MEIFESSEQRAQRQGYEEFDYMDTSDSKSEAPGGQSQDAASEKY